MLLGCRRPHVCVCRVGGSRESGTVSLRKECNLSGLVKKYFSSFLSLGHALHRIKQQLPKDRNKEEHRGPACTPSGQEQQGV